MKRATNRSPQEADCRKRVRGQDCGDANCLWHSHLRNCGGDFIKTREPEPKKKPGGTTRKKGGLVLTNAAGAVQQSPLAVAFSKAAAGTSAQPAAGNTAVQSKTSGSAGVLHAEADKGGFQSTNAASAGRAAPAVRAVADNLWIQHESEGHMLERAYDAVSVAMADSAEDPYEAMALAWALEESTAANRMIPAAGLVSTDGSLRRAASKDAFMHGDRGPAADIGSVRHPGNDADGAAAIAQGEEFPRTAELDATEASVLVPCSAGPLLGDAEHSYGDEQSNEVPATGPGRAASVASWQEVEIYSDSKRRRDQPAAAQYSGVSEDRVKGAKEAGPACGQHDALTSCSRLAEPGSDTAAVVDLTDLGDD